MTFEINTLLHKCLSLIFQSLNPEWDEEFLFRVSGISSCEHLEQVARYIYCNTWVMSRKSLLSAYRYKKKVNVVVHVIHTITSSNRLVRRLWKFQVFSVMVFHSAECNTVFSLSKMNKYSKKRCQQIKHFNIACFKFCGRLIVKRLTTYINLSWNLIPNWIYHQKDVREETIAQLYLLHHYC